MRPVESISGSLLLEFFEQMIEFDANFFICSKQLSLFSLSGTWKTRLICLTPQPSATALGFAGIVWHFEEEDYSLFSFEIFSIYAAYSQHHFTGWREKSLWWWWGDLDSFQNSHHQRTSSDPVDLPDCTSYGLVLMKCVHIWMWINSFSITHTRTHTETPVSSTLYWYPPVFVSRILL